MNKETSLRTGGSLFERAVEIYGLPAELRTPGEAETPAEPPAEQSSGPGAELTLDQPADGDPGHAHRRSPAAPSVSSSAQETPRTTEPFGRPRRGRRAPIDREALAAAGFILPDAPAGALPEEFRIIKRQLLLDFVPGSGRDQVILVASAGPGEGKSFCALNLALSLAGEKDLEVLLVDGDVAKAELPSLLGVQADAGLVDAIVDVHSDPEDYVLETDIPGLLLLSAGRRTPDVTELLASARTSEVLSLLTERHPNRIVIFDSPPALMASPASVLAGLAGQVMMVVRADKTAEADLREAISLLSACDKISLVLNGTRLLGGGSRFGSYYGYGP